MSRHMKTTLTRGALAPLVVALAIIVPPLGAQVPEGWYATANFQFCPGEPFASARGRVLIIDPDTSAQFEVEGLPDDLRSIPCNVTQGAASILIRPEDGALIVGEITAMSETLDIYVLELDGFAVDHAERFPVGTPTGPANEVSQMAFLGDGRILFSAGFLANGDALGVFDPSDPDQPVRTFRTPASGVGALTVDLEEDAAYFVDDGGRSLISAVSLSELLEANAAEVWPVASVPMEIQNLSMSPGGKLLAVGFGAQAGLFAIDPESGEADLLCTNIGDSRADANAMAVDPRREEIVVHFGGPVNNRGFSRTVVAFKLEDGGCSVEKRGVSSRGAHGVLNGIAVSPGSPEPRLAFLRGDCNSDGAVNVADASCALNWLFAGAPEPGCLAALNTNGDAAVDIADPVSLLNFLFGGGPIITDPFPACGPGALPADRTLGCANPPNCQ